MPLLFKSLANWDSEDQVAQRENIVIRDSFMIATQNIRVIFDRCPVWYLRIHHFVSHFYLYSKFSKAPCLLHSIYTVYAWNFLEQAKILCIERTSLVPLSHQKVCDPAYFYAYSDNTKVSFMSGPSK